MQVLDDAGATLVEFNYFEPVDAVAAELAVIFETEPTVSPFTGGGDTPPGTNYDWGSILIRDGWPMSEPFYPGYHVFITGNTVGALSISAIGEISIGDDFDAIAAAHPFNDPPLPGYASIDTLDLPDNPDFPGSQLTFSVLVIGDAGGGQVTRMIAPSSNWGA